MKYFKIGTVGTFDGVKYTVIGQVNKHVTYRYQDKWDEILLLSETGEISYLNCSYGNYTWVKEDHTIPAQQLLASIEKRFELDGQDYEFFQSYNYVSKHCIGEFPYDPIDVKGIKCSDYISPPYVISIEKHKNGRISTFKGRHMTRKQVSSMFNDYRIESQDKDGIGIAQPVLGGIDVTNFNKISFGLILLTLVISFTWASMRSSRQIVQEVVQIPSSSTTTPEFVSKTFYLDSTSNYLAFSTRSNLSNEWIETALTLVNEVSGEEREFGIVSEYYSGVDNGYSWSEGSNEGTANLSSVPGGRYHLKAKIFSSITSDKTLVIEAKYSGPELWNALLIVLTLLGLMIIINILKSRYEAMRKGEIDNLFESKS